MVAASSNTRTVKHNMLINDPTVMMILVPLLRDFNRMDIAYKCCRNRTEQAVKAGDVTKAHEEYDNTIAASGSLLQARQAFWNKVFELYQEVPEVDLHSFADVNYTAMGAPDAVLIEWTTQEPITQDQAPGVPQPSAN